MPDWPGTVTTLACLVHWYEATLLVVPTGAVSAWSWWRTRRIDHRKDEREMR